MKEKICPACKKWNAGDEMTCGYCNSLLDKNTIRKKEKELINTQESSVITQPRWIANLILKAQTSHNPVVRFFLKSAVIIWMIYMAMVGFVLWSVAWLAG